MEWITFVFGFISCKIGHLIEQYITYENEKRNQYHLEILHNKIDTMNEKMDDIEKILNLMG